MAEKVTRLRTPQNATVTGVISDPEQGLTGPFANPNPNTYFLTVHKLEPESLVTDSSGNSWRVLNWEQMGNRRLYTMAKEV